MLKPWHCSDDARLQARGCVSSPCSGTAMASRPWATFRRAQRSCNGDIGGSVATQGGWRQLHGYHPPDGGGRAGRQGEQQQRVLVRIIVFYDGKPITNAYTPLFYDSLHCFMAERRLVVKQTTMCHGFCLILWKNCEKGRFLRRLIEFSAVCVMVFMVMILIYSD